MTRVKAVDFYTFIRLREHFEAEEAAALETMPGDLRTPDSGHVYFDNYEDAQKQIKRYESLRDELMALSLDSEPERLLSAAVTLTNIASLYGAYEMRDESLALLFRAKDIHEKAYGPQHYSVATSCEAIAAALTYLGQHKKALSNYLKALSIFDNLNGKSNHDSAGIHHSIALIYSGLGDFEKALRSFTESYKIFRQLLGEENKLTQTAKRNLEATENYMAIISH